MRYGRPLNHMKVQHAEVKFFLHCDQQLSDADELYKTANKAMADSADMIGNNYQLTESIRLDLCVSSHSWHHIQLQSYHMGAIQLT